MLDRIKRFFDDNMSASPGNADAGPAGEHRMALASAALLVEMARIDDEILDVEQETLSAILKQQFSLSQSEATALIELADEEMRASRDYYQFTSLINEHFTPVQKIAVLENLWRVAYADSTISAHERHLMRKLADLLHIPHGDHMLAKDRAKAASGNH